ncbi:diacylglycerol/polyprenol kinase family protein [Methanoculleus frigidifontis]|nr:phosphatidate cytidylyltransferase [Methanoculleus sp. FWC-SCC1]
MNESSRQLVHLVFGLGIAGFVFLFDSTITISVLMIALFAGFILSDAVQRGYTIPGISQILERLERRDAVPGKGALFFALGALFCLIFFPTDVVFPALVVLALLDSVTTIVGVRYGRHRIYNKKSLEGSAAGILVTFVVLLLLVPPGAALAAAVVAGLVEFATPVDDNLVVPVAACLVLTLFV